jgi:transposase
MADSWRDDPVRAALSGKTSGHRLSRGGDRNANHALYQVVLVRMASCQRKDYVAKHTAEGKSNGAIMRCLKRYAAREIYCQDG